MNLMGKILVVSIFAMSLVFMAFSIMLYGTHTNWRDVVTNPNNGLKKQLTDLRAENQNLQTTHAQRVAELNTARTLDLQARAKVENENQALIADKERLLAEVDQLRTARTAATSGFNAAQANLTALRTEVQALRDEIRTAQQAENEAFVDATSKNQQLLESTSRLDLLKARETELVQAIADLRQKVGAVGPGAAPTVPGIVLDLSNNNRVEVSIGSDDGIDVGHELDVYRGQTYLGRVRVDAIEPDRAVASVIPAFRKGSIQRGDRVITVRQS